MKVLLFCTCLIHIFWLNPMDWKGVMNDFDKKFDYSRFSKNVLLVREDHQKGIFDSTTILTKTAKRNAWAKINAVMGVCDYIGSKDSRCTNCFFIRSDKAYQKFWVKYDDSNKIAVIKIIKPKVSRHLIPPPCGY